MQSAEGYFETLAKRSSTNLQHGVYVICVCICVRSLSPLDDLRRRVAMYLEITVRYCLSWKDVRRSSKIRLTKGVCLFDGTCGFRAARDRYIIFA